MAGTGGGGDGDGSGENDKGAGAVGIGGITGAGSGGIGDGLRTRSAERNGDAERGSGLCFTIVDDVERVRSSEDLGEEVEGPLGRAEPLGCVSPGVGGRSPNVGMGGFWSIKSEGSISCGAEARFDDLVVSPR